MRACVFLKGLGMWGRMCVWFLQLTIYADTGLYAQKLVFQKSLIAMCWPFGACGPIAAFRMRAAVTL